MAVPQPHWKHSRWGVHEAAGDVIGLHVVWLHDPDVATVFYFGINLSFVTFRERLCLDWTCVRISSHLCAHVSVYVHVRGRGKGERRKEVEQEG